MKHIFIALSLALSTCTLFGKVDPPTNTEQVLQLSVRDLLQVDGELILGTPAFDAAVLKKLTTIGMRDKIVLAMIERSANSKVGVTIESWLAYLSFEWVQEEQQESNSGAFAYHARLEIELDQTLMPHRAKVSIRKETLPEFQLVPAKSGFGIGNTTK